MLLFNGGFLHACLVHIPMGFAAETHLYKNRFEARLAAI